MNALRTAVAEIWGLFVDDGWFAVYIIVWIALVAILRSRLPAWSLFLGLAVLVIVFARRRAVTLSYSKRSKENSDL